MRILIVLVLAAVIGYGYWDKWRLYEEADYKVTPVLHRQDGRVLVELRFRQPDQGTIAKIRLDGELYQGDRHLAAVNANCMRWGEEDLRVRKETETEPPRECWIWTDVSLEGLVEEMTLDEVALTKDYKSFYRQSLWVKGMATAWRSNPPLNYIKWIDERIPYLFHRS